MKEYRYFELRMQWIGANQIYHLKQKNNNKATSSRDDDNNNNAAAENDISRRDPFEGDNVNDNDDDDDDDENDIAMLEQQQRSHLYNTIPHETIEAALNRLSKSYNIAMESFSTWNKLDQALFEASKTNHTETTTTTLRTQPPPTFPSISTDVTSTTTTSTSTTTNVVTTNNKNDSTSDPIKDLIRIGQCARKVFEEAILLDPLIATHYAATFSQTYEQIENEYDTKATFQEMEKKDPTISLVEECHVIKQRQDQQEKRRVNAIQLSSAVNKATVQNIAFLSLVNYADLIVTGLPPSTFMKKDTTILDRGIVPPLRCFPRTGMIRNDEDKDTTNFAKKIPDPISLLQLTNTCWSRTITVLRQTNHRRVNTPIKANNMSMHQEQDTNRNDDVANQVDSTRMTTAIESTSSQIYSFDESMKDSVRLALVAYLDATSLDGSDPTVWLKLACTARRLGRILHSEQQQEEEDTFTSFLRFRRLERYALEKALSCRSSSEGPNRTAVRAWHQWEQEEKEEYSQSSYIRTTPILPTKEKGMTLEITTYSWIWLAKLLIKVCHEGSTYTSGAHRRTSTSSKNVLSVDNDATASPYISLGMTPFVGLPPFVMATIGCYVGRSELWRLASTCRIIATSMKYAQSFVDMVDQPTIVDVTETAESSSFENLPLEILDPVAESSTVIETTEPKIVKAASRTSNRLRSHILVTEKRTERNKRRQSVGYCLIAAIFGCTNENEEYLALVSEGNNNNAPYHSYSDRSQPQSVDDKSMQGKGNDSSKTDHIWNECSSMANFIAKWRSPSRSTPIAMLFSFVAYVAVNVSHVFSKDPNESMSFSNIILECKYDAWSSVVSRKITFWLTECGF
jgi:hypothetical protein